MVRPTNAAAGRTLAYEMADEIGVRYLQVVGPYEGSVARGRARPSARCATARPRTSCWSGVEWLPFTNIRTAAEAVDIVEAADRPNAGYCVDIWHHKRGADDESQIRALPVDRIFAVQMNDGTLAAAAQRLQGGLSGQSRASRRGRVRLRRLRSAADRMGVRSPISLEVCSTELWAAPAREAAQRAADAMRAVLAEAGA